MSWQSKLKKSNFDVAPLPGAFPLPAISLNLNYNDPNVPIPVVARDPVFLNRIESAILKSFKYIDRIDDISAGIIAPDSHNSELILSNKSKKFANLFRKKVNTGMK